jgi:hypothetical protein
VHLKKGLSRYACTQKTFKEREGGKKEVCFKNVLLFFLFLLDSNYFFQDLLSRKLE